jgi:hypothetical protein
VHSLVLELTGKKERADGLQGKFSVYHGCAARLNVGCACEPEFADHIDIRSALAALRRKEVASVNDAIDDALADVTAVLRDGRRVHVFVEHAICPPCLACVRWHAREGSACGAAGQVAMSRASCPSSSAVLRCSASRRFVALHAMQSVLLMRGSTIVVSVSSPGFTFKFTALPVRAAWP